MLSKLSFQRVIFPIQSANTDFFYAKSIILLLDDNRRNIKKQRGYYMETEHLFIT